MESNRGNTGDNQKGATLHQTLSREKETLVTMFLSSASDNELAEQIRKIDELCSKLDQKPVKPPAE